MYTMSTHMKTAVNVLIPNHNKTQTNLTYLRITPHINQHAQTKGTNTYTLQNNINGITNKRKELEQL